MQEFTNELLKLRNRCGEHAQQLGVKHAVDISQPPVGALGMCFNHTTFSLEVASHYASIWGHLKTLSYFNPEQIPKAKAENTERLIFLSKTTFVWCMSAIEHVAISAMIAHPSAVDGKKVQKNLPFSDMIKLSTRAGLTHAGQEPLWLGANTVRNECIHNNGIAKKTETFRFSDKCTLDLVEGQMTQGSIMTFPRLTTWVVDAYSDWADRFLTKIA